MPLPRLIARPDRHLTLSLRFDRACSGGRPAAAIFQLLIECFDGYAEGYNYLGLIALARNDQRAAIAHFEKTIELGRKLFPAKVARKCYWSDHDTRPYMRGLRNLTLALVERGREAFDRLHEMQSVRFAAIQATELADLISMRRAPAELSDHLN